MEMLKIFAKTVDEVALGQIRQMSECEAYRKCLVRIMPDCHAGSNCTVGTIIKMEGRVIPNTLGVDIGCRMLEAEFKDIALNLQHLDDVVNTQILSGFIIHEKPIKKYDSLSLLKCLNAIDREKALCTIGSLGGGNHFIEVDKDDEGHVNIVIHSGSRNLGVKVCKHYQQPAVKERMDTSAKVRALIDRLKKEGRFREIYEAIRKVQRSTIQPELT